MSFGKVAAGNGVQWLSSAFNIAMKNPGVFLVMALIVGAISAIPVVSLAMIIIGPALYGGYMYTAQKQDRNEPIQIGDLFAAFQIPGKAGPMLMLCLPGIAAVIVISVLAVIFVGGAIMAMMSGSGEMGAAGFGGIMIVGLIAIAVYLVLAAMMFFAIPRVMLDGVEPFAALKESVSAVLANIGAVLVFGLILILIVMVSCILMIIPILGALVVISFASLIFALGCYTAYTQVFGGAAVAMPAAPMPPAPPAM